MDSPRPDPALRTLTAFLRDPRQPLPALGVLRRYHLGAYAYSVLGPAAPLREALREDHRRATLRHGRVRAEVQPLLRAWGEAGLPVMVLKGFHLAEFVYPSPALRHYDGADMLLAPGHLARALEVAQARGWRELRDAVSALTPPGHAPLRLASADGQVSLNVHRHALHTPSGALQDRITAEVWRRRQPLPWPGVSAPHPVDALIVGLILNRLWAPGGWSLQPQDFLDFRALVQAHGLTNAELVARARQLGCLRTLRLFLGRCDGFRNRLDLRAPTPGQRLRWALELWPERGPLTVRRALVTGGRLPPLALDVLRELPTVLRATRALRTGSSVPRVLESMWPAPVAAWPASPREVQRTVRGVHWSLTLLRVRPGANCLPRALALFAALRRRGHPVVFCSGVRRGRAEIEGHAWVELDGAPLEDPYVREDVSTYRVTLCFPADGTV